MLLKVLRFVVSSVIEATGKACPKCGSTNANKENGIWHCFDCGKEF
jgi:ribosomal protein L37AE/L43A